MKKPALSQAPEAATEAEVKAVPAPVAASVAAPAEPAAEPAPEPAPQAGGSYVRQPDGTLDRVEYTRHAGDEEGNA